MFLIYMVKTHGCKPELLTKDEMDRLLNVVVGDLFFSMFYKTLRFSGRRTGEIYGTVRRGKLFGGVRVKDVDFEEHTMKTQILKTRKQKWQRNCERCDRKSNAKDRFCSACGFDNGEVEIKKIISEVTKMMSMRPEVEDILRIYIKKARLKQSDYLFRKYSLVYLKKKIKTHCKQAQITKKFSLHGFRHYFISMCKKEGMSNEDIAKWTGHLDPNTLNIYNQLTPDDVRDKIESIDL